MNFTICTSNPFTSPSILATFARTKEKKTNLSLENVVYYSVSHIIPFCPYFFTWKCSLQWLIGLVWSLWLLLFYQYRNLTEKPLRYPVVTLCHRDSVVHGVFLELSLHIQLNLHYKQLSVESSFLTPHTWVVEHGETKWILTMKLHAYWLAFIVLEFAMQSIGGKK